MGFFTFEGTFQHCLSSFLIQTRTNRKGAQQDLVQQNNVKQINLRSCSMYGGFQFHTCMECTTRILGTILHEGGSTSIKWIVLPEHFEFASSGFKLLLRKYVLKQNYMTSSKQINHRSGSMYGGFQLHTCMNCTTRIL